ncbi:hypothetical protein BofuT4_uP147970.1 [Botrytis cinerea T4]|uniref:Uncharacterized protein n=1 Tax=Botryotinia fuckeliana (strain T4) TaxID=999810 RepID=G2YXL6_BOTF4|nr:hypothetical protein BofuT4_uP147970.1 [Botrytis cinerea T4]
MTVSACLLGCPDLISETSRASPQLWKKRSRGRKAKKIYSGGGARSSPPTAGITFCK